MRESRQVELRRQNQLLDNEQYDIIQDICEVNGPKMDRLDQYWRDNNLPEKLCEEVSK